MIQSKDKFFDVTMRVEVKRRVLASSKEEAHEKVDTSDMVYEIKNYRLDETVHIEEVEGEIPSDEDRIEDIDAQIVKNSSEPMYLLKEKYEDIHQSNSQGAALWEPSYEAFALIRMIDDFINRLKS